MKFFILLMPALLFSSGYGLYSGVNPQIDDSRSDLYLQDYGQKPPGKIPVLFSPNFVRIPHRIHSSPAFSPDRNEVYWSVFSRTSEIKHRQDGKKLMFYSKRPLDNTSNTETNQILLFRRMKRSYSMQILVVFIGGTLLF